MAGEIYQINYSYFGKSPDVDDSVSGYASEVKRGVKAYFWMHTVSEIINSLTNANMHIEYFNEFTENFFNPSKKSPLLSEAQAG